MKAVLQIFVEACPRQASRMYRGILVRRAQKLHLRGETTQAVKDFERALAIVDGDCRAHVQYAIAMLDTGNAAKAVELLDAAKYIEPGNPVPRIFLGLALSDAGRNAEACEALSQACAMADSNLLPKTCLALARIRDGQFSVAAAQLKQEGIADNIAVRARILTEVESILHQRADQRLLDYLLPARSKSEEEQKPAAPNDSESPRRCYKRGRQAFDKGRFAEAQMLFEGARDRGCEEADLPLYLGGSYLAGQRYDEAAGVFLDVPDKSPIRPPAIFYAGVARYHQGDPESALTLIDEAIAAGAAFDLEEYVYHYRGLCLQAMGDIRGARKVYERALDVDWELLPRRLAALEQD